MYDSRRTGQMDCGPGPYAANIERMAVQNLNFRTAVWTGCRLQMTLMCIPVHGEIGLELHEDTDQFLRVEEGMAFAELGMCRNQPDYQQKLCEGDGLFVPAGFWHNIRNAGRSPLKISSIYAPPHHPRGTVQASGSKTD